MTYNSKLNGEFCIYLRKSRADIEAEGIGEEDTYSRHMNTLITLQKKLGISITEIYKEKPITGERISARPEILRLLNDVEEGRWRGVLVVEVERLARGDTMDQGIVAQAFKYSNTLIITPMRTYDPNNLNDEEYFEFGLFMSRREFKTINRRLQGGRTDGVMEGRYMGSIAPYGYRRIKLPKKGYTLEPHPEQAMIVQLIFSLYTNTTENHMGCQLIANHLNERNIPTSKNGKWGVPTLNSLLRNPIYMGNVRWKSRPIIKKRDSTSRSRKLRNEWVEAKGLHPSLIEVEVFNKAQIIMSKKSHNSGPKSGKAANPLAGLMRCGICSALIVKKSYNGRSPDALICSTPRCKNKGSYFHIVEDRVLQGLAHWLESYRIDWEINRPQFNSKNEIQIQANSLTIKTIENRINDLEKQKISLHDYLELKVYTIEVFLDRSKNIQQRIDEAKNSLEKLKSDLNIYQQRDKARTQIIPKVEHVLDIYKHAQTIEEKNMLLKSVVSSMIYTKLVGGRWSGAIDKFTLEIFPKLPDKE